MSWSAVQSRHVSRHEDGAPLPAGVADALRLGKLEQACPDCGRWEAAGWYCTGCTRPMGPNDWYPNGDLHRRGVARQKAPQKSQTPGKRGRGRPRADLPAVVGSQGAAA